MSYGTGLFWSDQNDLRLGTRGYDPEWLRAGLRAVRLERIFRVAHRDHRGTPLAAVPAPNRFSDPQARYAVLSAGRRCATHSGRYSVATVSRPTRSRR